MNEMIWSVCVDTVETDIYSSRVLNTEIDFRRPAIRNGMLRVRINGSYSVERPCDPNEL